MANALKPSGCTLAHEGEAGLRLGPTSLLARYGTMSLEIIALGVIACLFALIALMPRFDGKWD